MNSSRKAELKLDWCSHAAAKYAVEHWHYSRKMPAGKRVQIGVWEGGRFIGVVVFGTGACPQIACPFGLDRLEVAELVRVALREHFTPVSRIISVALRLLRQQSPGLRLVVSYADPKQGHYGGIYQASGWYYLGTSGAHWTVKGLHNRLFGTSKTRARRRFGQAVCFDEEEPKYKYACTLDQTLRPMLETMSKPYPKRAGGVRGDTPADQAGEGGSSPTPALSGHGP